MVPSDTPASSTMGSNVSKEVPCNNGERSYSSTDDGLTNNNTNDKTHQHHDDLPKESNNDDHDEQRNLPPEVWAGIYECE